MSRSDTTLAEWEMDLTLPGSPLPWASPGAQLIQGALAGREGEKNDKMWR